MAFERATTVKQVDSHTYSADFQEDWCIGAGKLRCRPAFDPTYVLPLHSAHSPRSLSIALSSFVGASSGLLRPYTSYAGMLITGDSPTRWLRNFNNPSKYIRHETFPKTYLSPNLFHFSPESRQEAFRNNFEQTRSTTYPRPTSRLPPKNTNRPSKIHNQRCQTRTPDLSRPHHALSRWA